MNKRDIALHAYARMYSGTVHFVISDLTELFSLSRFMLHHLLTFYFRICACLHVAPLNFPNT